MLDLTPDQRHGIITELEEALAAAEIDAARRHLELWCPGVTDGDAGLAHDRAGLRLAEERVVMLRAHLRHLLPDAAD